MFPTDSTEIEIGLRILILTPTALFWVLLMVRIVGLRTFSKMTAFDFVSTVAVGSLLASAATVSAWPAYWQTIGAIIMILVTQAILSKWRQSSDIAPHVLENSPVILFRDGTWNEGALKKTRTTKADIWGKMREANVLDISEVRAITLESTGDVSVLHGDHLSEDILTGVTETHANS